MTETKTLDVQSTRIKIGTMFLCFVLAVAMVWPTQTRAQTYTVAELRTLLSQLLVQLNALQAAAAPSGVCPYIWTRSLGQGSTGFDVLRLQQFLNASSDTRLAGSGAGSPGLETQYYGPITAAAVSRFQTKYRAQILTPLGLINPTGYFGPSSMAAANRICTDSSTNPPTGDDPVLHGTAGSLSDVRLISRLTNEAVGEGQRDVPVMGVELRPQGSDVELSAVTIDLDQIGNISSFDRYAEDVTIWLDGELYATVDADSFTRSNDYRQTISLERGAIIRQNDTAELVVAVSGARNIDSSRFGDEWRVAFDSVRFRDALSASITDSQTRGLDRTFSFSEYSESVGLRLTVQNGDAAINDAHLIQVSDTDRTRDVPVLSFKIAVDGDSDVLLDTLRVNATTTGATLDRIASAAYLYLDGSRIGGEDIVSAADTITFTDLDRTLRADRTYDLEVRLDLNQVNGANYSSGVTLRAGVNSSDRDDWYLEDERGNAVASFDRRGSASSGPHTLQTSGAGILAVTSTSREVYNSSVPAASYGEYRMTVEVRALGDTVYIPESAVRSIAASDAAGLTFYFEDASGTAYNAGVGTQSFTRLSGGRVENGLVRIDEGQTARFELVATLDPAQFGQYRVQVVSIGWNDAAAAPDTFSLANPAVNYRSGLQVISN